MTLGLVRRFALALALAWPALAVHAQVAAPITVTPRSLAPAPEDKRFRPDVPLSAPLAAPAGSEGLAVTPGTVTVEGGFAELAEFDVRFVAALSGRRVTLGEIYGAAAALESAYASAGYVFARVSVPPQDLRDGGPLRVVVVDGFIERVETAALPARVRSLVAARFASLVGRRHLRYGTLERALMLANDLPGLALRSTLARGDSAGGTVLVLEGRQAAVSGSLGFANDYDASLDTYGFSAQLSLNSLLGHGEQIYGFVASGYDLVRLFRSDARVRVLGGGLLLPLAEGRATINPEVTVARTRPIAQPGAPQTLGKLRRLTLRGDLVLQRTRFRRLALTGAIENIDERNDLPDFAATLNRDRYSAVRLGVALRAERPAGGAIVGSLQISQGLGGLGAITRVDAATSGVPFTRQGARPDFTKLQANARLTVPFGGGAQVSLSAAGQSSFGRPLVRAEQFSLEGSDGLSAYVGGLTAADAGVVGRAELALPVGLDPSPRSVIVPYLFAAAGYGRLEAPTAVEPGHFAAANLGAGFRFDAGANGPAIGLEYAHGFSGYAPLQGADRLNLTVGVRF